MAEAMDSMTALLTLMLVAVTGLGVLGGVVLDTHEPIRELGVHKALGMTPRQTLAPVLTSVVPAGLVGAAGGVPLGMSVHGVVTRSVGRSAGPRLPESVLSVYGTPLLRTATALRTE